MAACGNRSLIGQRSGDVCGTRETNRSKEDCCPTYFLLGDPCHVGLCCETPPKVRYRPFIPSYERNGHGQQVWWYSERNTWQVWKTTRNNNGCGNQCNGM